MDYETLVLSIVPTICAIESEILTDFNRGEINGLELVLQEIRTIYWYQPWDSNFYEGTSIMDCETIILGVEKLIKIAKSASSTDFNQGKLKRLKWTMKEINRIH